MIAYLGAQGRGLNPAKMLDTALTAALGGLVGARLVYAAAHWDYYQDHLWEALRIWGGGLAWHGALAGGLAGVLAYCGLRHISARVTLDILTPAIALLAICAWLGCLLDKCACGVETYPGQGLLWALSLELPDLYGIRAPRVAVQLLGAAWSAVALAALIIARRRARFEALAFPLWLATYPAGSLLLGFVRADAVALVAGWRADQVVDLALAVTGLTALGVGLLRKRRLSTGNRPVSP